MYIPEGIAMEFNKNVHRKITGNTTQYYQNTTKGFEFLDTTKGFEFLDANFKIEAQSVAGRPKLTWKKLTERDCREWRLTTVDPQERSTWRSGVRSAMREASQLPGKGPTKVDDAPAPARKSNYDDEESKIAKGDK